MEPISSNQSEEQGRDPLLLLRELLEQARMQTMLLSEIRVGLDLDACFLDKIAQIVCLLANETHKNTQSLAAIRESLNALLELYKSVHPEQALQLDKIEKLQAELRKCCPPDEHVDLICEYEPCEPHGGITPGDGYSMKSKGFIRPVPFSERPHAPWKIVPHIPHEADEGLPVVLKGPIVGQIVPSAPTPQAQDFCSGSPVPGPRNP